MVLGDNPTPQRSPSHSIVVVKTPTMDYRLADLAATVNGSTGDLHRQYPTTKDISSVEEQLFGMYNIHI